MPRSNPQQPIQVNHNLPKRRVTHIIIPIEIWNSDLPVTAKVLLAEISSLDDPEMGCFASNAYFSKFLGVTEIRVSQLIRMLVEKGFVEYRHNKYNSRNNRSLSLKIDFKAALKQILNIYISSKEDIKTLYKNLNTAKGRAVSRKGANPSILNVVNHFKSQCKDVLGIEPDIEPKDYALVKKKLTSKSESELKQIISDCLTAKNTQWQRDHPTLSVFLSANTINQLKMNKTNGRHFTKERKPGDGFYGVPVRTCLNVQRGAH